MDKPFSFYMQNDELRDYFVSLEPVVQRRILESDSQIATLGELMMCSESIRKEINPND